AITEHDIDWDNLDVELLSKFLPHGLYDKISTGRGAMVSGEHRNVTVMFINYSLPEGDFLNNPGELKVRLDRYYRMVNQAISSMGGIITRVDCYSKGDKVLAVFGAMKAHQDDEIRAAKAAIMMRRKLESINKETGWGIKQKVGINGGKAFCGDVGGMERREYTVMGDDVNLAARLMSKADDDSILLGEKTTAKLSNSIPVESAGEVTVKGKSDKIKVFNISDDTDAETDAAAEALSAHSGPMVGRKSELDIVKAHINKALNGNFSSIVIQGEAGIGKSRLTAEFLNLANGKEFEGYIGACQSYGSSTPFLPLKTVFEELFDVKSDSENRERLDRIVNENKLQGWEPVLNDILELNIPETPETRNLNSRIRRQRLFDLLYAALAFRAKESPYYLIIEDIHWIDDTSYEFLNHLFENDPVNGMMFVGVTRPDQKIEKSPAYIKSELIELHALPPEEAASLIGSMLNIREIPDKLKSLVLERSQGNPFYTGEIVRSLIDSGFIEKDENTGEMIFSGDVDDIDLPDNINSLVLSRIDRLPEATKDVIKTASIIGRSFTLDLLREVFPYEVNENELTEHLEKLSSLDLTPVDRQGANPAYIFKHIMTQEVAYNCQSFKARELLHEKVGFALEQKYSENLHPHLEILAHHFSKSRCKPKAFDYLLKAGDKAVSIYANDEAVRFLTSAESQFARPGRLPGYITPERIYHILKHRGHVRLRVGRYDEALSDYRKLYKKTTKWKRGEWVTEVLNYIAETHWLKGEYSKAVKWANEALRISAENNDKRGKASSIFSLAEIARRKADFKTAVERFHDSIALYKKLADDAETASCYNSLGVTLWATGALDDALTAYNEALQFRHKLSDLDGEAKILNNIGLIYLDTGKIENALENFKKAASIFERIGDRRNRSYCLGNIGYIQKNLANYTEAESAFIEALNVLQKIGDTAGTAYTFSNLGDLYLQMYRPQPALDNHLKALELAKQLGDEELICEVQAGIAFDKLAEGNYQEAQHSARQAYEIGDRIGAKIYTIKALNALVEIGSASGVPDFEEYTLKLMELSKDDMSEYGSHAQFILGKYYMSLARPDKAREYFSNALEVALKGGFKKLEWESRHMIGKLLVSRPDNEEFLKLGQKELKSASEIVKQTAATISPPDDAEDFLAIPQIKSIVDFENTDSTTN
ncbi:MAG: tetratricopeptide repeat protein, partial [candidate division Zixibacteria bacterium]|nr:tetratricopeptide repeat protein [candidate division Zixibacteria bacterium]